MALCKDCVHYELCKRNGATVDFPVDDGVCLTFATPEALRPVGRWIKKKPGDKKIYCSRCGRQNGTHTKRPFCSGYGARMKERKEQ
jgi:hypothetical protein